MKKALTSYKLTILKEKALQSQTLPLTTMIDIAQAKNKKQVIGILKGFQ